MRLLYGERGEQLTADIEDVMTALESISKPSEVMIAEEDTIGCPVSVDEDGMVETLQNTIEPVLSKLPPFLSGAVNA